MVGSGTAAASILDSCTAVAGGSPVETQSGDHHHDHEEDDYHHDDHDDFDNDHDDHEEEEDDYDDY